MWDSRSLFLKKGSGLAVMVSGSIRDQIAWPWYATFLFMEVDDPRLSREVVLFFDGGERHLETPALWSKHTIVFDGIGPHMHPGLYVAEGIPLSP